MAFGFLTKEHKEPSMCLANLVSDIYYEHVCLLLLFVVPDVGIELTTYRLQGGCSTTELIRHNGI